MGGKLDQAVEALKTSFENSAVRSEWMAVDKELDPIREHPGYIQLVKKHCPEYLPDKLKQEEQEDEGEEAPEEDE
jgi:hypothetical protein